MGPLIQVRLRRGDARPLYEQVYLALAERIGDGDLPAGARLPPTRQLARVLGINRSTVVAAYDELAAAGLVEARVGDGTRVLAAPRPAPHRGAPREIADEPVWRPSWNAALSTGMRALMEMPDPPAMPAAENAIDLAHLYPDETLFPVTELRRAMNAALASGADTLLQYGSALGHTPLREYLARRARAQGMRVEEAGVIVLNGAQQGLDLLCRVLLDRGDAVVVESPTYQGVLPLLRFHGARLRPVAMTPSGLDLEALEHTLTGGAVKLLYTMPNFQNPTGITTDLAHRQRLLEIAARHRVPVVEDGFEEDLRFAGRAIAPLKALDPGHQVVYLGTFSKGLVPGLRIGWLAADPDLVDLVARAKRTTDLHTPTALQAALHEFCRRGDYDRHLKRVQKVCSLRLAAALEALARELPRGCTFTRPLGGYALWVTLPEGLSGAEVARTAAAAGVLVAPGESFFATPPATSSLRLSISRADPARLRTGIAILGRVLRAAIAAHGKEKTTRHHSHALPSV